KPRLTNDSPSLTASSRVRAQKWHSMRRDFFRSKFSFAKVRRRDPFLAAWPEMPSCIFSSVIDALFLLVQEMFSLLADWIPEWRGQPDPPHLFWNCGSFSGTILTYAATEALHSAGNAV